MSDKAKQDIMRRPDAHVEVKRIDNAFERHRHVGEGVIVESKLQLDLQPKLELSWGVLKKYWNYTLLLYHNTKSFAPNYRPSDLGEHGNLILETRRNDTKTLSLEEGTHFFTFILRREPFISFFGEFRSQPLRFSVHVPTAKTMLSRIKDAKELADLEHSINLTPYNYEIETNEAFARLIESRKKLDRVENPPAVKETPVPKPFVNPQVAVELQWIDALVEALFAKETKREEILKSAAYLKLSPESQKLVLDAIDERLHPGELNARRERGQS